MGALVLIVANAVLFSCFEGQSPFLFELFRNREGNCIPTLKLILAHSNANSDQIYVFWMVLDIRIQLASRRIVSKRTLAAITRVSDRFRFTAVWSCIVIVLNIILSSASELTCEFHWTLFDRGSWLEFHFSFLVKVFLRFSIAPLQSIESQRVRRALTRHSSRIFENQRVLFAWKSRRLLARFPYFSIFVDFVLENLTPIGSFRWVLDKHSFHKLLNERRNCWLFWKLQIIILDSKNQFRNASWLERTEPVKHSVKNDSEWPDISFESVILAFENFWRHVDWRSDINVFKILFRFK